MGLISRVSSRTYSFIYFLEMGLGTWIGLGMVGAGLVLTKNPKAISRLASQAANQSKATLDSAKTVKDCAKKATESLKKSREESQKSFFENSPLSNLFKQATSKPDETVKPPPTEKQEPRKAPEANAQKQAEENLFSIFDQMKKEMFDSHSTGGFKDTTKQGMELQEARQILQFDAGNPNITKKDILDN